MRLSDLGQKQSEHGLMVEFIRVSLFLLILLVSVFSSIAQGQFINFSVLAPFYGVLTLAFGSHLIWISLWDKIVQQEKILFLGFIFDSLFISILIYFFGVNQSLFLFLHLVNILLTGMVFRGSGALILALFTSIFYSGAILLSPELKGLNFFILLVLNNVAFFSIAGLAGYLSEQLYSVGRELKKTGISLRSIKELNQVLLDNIPTGMVSFEENGEVITVNHSAFSILEKNNLIGLNWYDLFPVLKEADIDNYKADVSYKPYFDQEAKIIGMTISKIHSSELQASLYIALFDDLTKIRQLEYSLRQNEKMAAIGGLAAGIAHEIRNPLAGISGSIELLGQISENEDDKKLMKIILREIDRLNNLITEFLEYSRPEVPPTDKIDLASVLKEVLESMKLDAKLRTDVEQVVSLESELYILGKKDKLKQVFLNIILNSYQAMNSFDSTNARPQVSVKGQVVDDLVKLRIKDNGCGMSEATKKKMFEPFHTTKPKGTGLGLAITHKILEGHGAQVFVESEQGVGTEFILTFPRAH